MPPCKTEQNWYFRSVFFWYDGHIYAVNTSPDAMETTDLRTDAGTFNQPSTLAALRSELIACKMRHLLYAATDVRKEEYLPSAAQMQVLDVVASFLLKDDGGLCCATGDFS